MGLLGEKNIRSETATERFPAKKSELKIRSTWFRVGVVLLSISAIWWVFMVAMGVDTGNWSAALGGGILFSSLPIGIGIYSVRRGRKALRTKQAIINKEKAEITAMINEALEVKRR